MKSFFGMILLTAGMLLTGMDVFAQQIVFCHNSASCDVEVYANYRKTGCAGALQNTGVAVPPNSVVKLTLPASTTLEDFQVCYGGTSGGCTAVTTVHSCPGGTHTSTGSVSVANCVGTTTSVDWHQPGGANPNGDYVLDINP